MASSNEPIPKVQRSFTLPAKFGDGSKAHASPKAAPSEAVETLFAHLSGKIVSFSPPITSIPRTRAVSVGGSIQDDGVVGVLPWASRIERTMAAGPIQVYRVTGSVAFLKSGNTLHPILPKSQCWCVDGESKFVLRIRGHNYYRIELPNNSEEDRNAADNLKRTLAEVLQYETTACPFKRGFHVELPDKPETPKKPWKPKHRPVSISPGPKASPGSLLPSSGDEGSVQASDRDGSSLSNTDDERNTPDISILETDLHKRNEEIRAKEQLGPERSSEKVETIVSAFEYLKSNKEPSLQSLPRSLQSPHAVFEEASSSPQSKNGASILIKDATLDTKRVPSNGGSSPKDVETLNGASPSSTGHSTISSAAHDVLLKPVEGVDKEVTENDDFLTEDTVQDRSNLNTPDAQMEFSTDSTTLDLDGSADANSISAHFNRDSTHKQNDIVATEQETPTFDQVSDHDSICAKPHVLDLGADKDPDFNESRDIDLSRHAHVVLPLHKDSSSIMANSIVSSGENDEHKNEDSPSNLHSSNTTSLPLNTSDSLPSSPTSSHASFESLESDEANSINGTEFVDADHFSSMPPSPVASPSSVLKHKLSIRRSQSPLPPSTTLYSPRDIISGYDVTTAVLQKTCHIMLAPPARLVSLMLNIAQRITNGLIRGESSMNIESGRRIPCSWDSDESDDDGDSEVLEDDFGNVFGELPKKTY